MPTNAAAILKQADDYLTHLEDAQLAIVDKGLRLALRNLEAELNKAKEEQQKLETALGDPANYSDKDKFVKIETDYKKAKQNRENLDKQYEVVFEKVMELEGQV